MIFDQENIFLDKATISGTTTSDTIATVGGGDAADPLFLVVAATTALTGSGITAALETSDTEAFTSKTVLGTYTLAASKKGVLAGAKVPYGVKKYLRLVLSGATAGVVTAGLTATVPNWP